jgi:hypothetical protein
MGRKPGDGSKFKQETADRICELMRKPMSLRRACLEVGINHTTVMNWRRDNEDFANQYMKTRLDQVEAYVDEVIDISDQATPEDFQVARLRTDKRQWYASKVAPKLYGDKLQVDQTVQGSLEMFMDSLAGTSLGPPAMRKRGNK